MASTIRIFGEAVTLMSSHSSDNLSLPEEYKFMPEKHVDSTHLRRRSIPLVLPNSSRLRIIGLTVLLLSGIALLSQTYVSGTTLATPWSTLRRSRQCEDPYRMPGYLLHDSAAVKARWIPYTKEILDSTLVPHTLPFKRNDTSIEAGILDLSPPSYASMLEGGAEKSLELYASELEPLRNKSVLILGCSLDRFFMESICPRLGAPFLNVMDNWHGIFRCTIPTIDLDIQLWFTYGALPEHKTSEETGRINIFEDRIRDHWLPATERLNLTTEPDLILWASGTWDVLGLRTKFREQDKEGWKEQAMSFQELAWHRMRLNEMTSFIRNRWPNVPTMYRPPTYTYKKDLPSWNGQLEGVREADIDQINEGVWRLTESAKAVMAANDMPVFTWGEKLIGNNQFWDTTHYRVDSYAQWLYAEMLLYYVHHYSMPKPSHCLATASQ